MSTGPIIAIAMVVGYVILHLIFKKRSEEPIDWAGWRLYRRRKHWHGKRTQGKRFGHKIISVSFSELDEADNRRISELIRDRDVESAAAMLEMAGVNVKEAIDRAELYTLRPHPDAETKGYPADYAAKEKARSRRKRVGFGDAPTKRLSEAEIMRRITEPAAPADPEILLREKIDRLALQGRRMDAISLYCSHFGVGFKEAEAAVKRGVRPRVRRSWFERWRAS